MDLNVKNICVFVYHEYSFVFGSKKSVGLNNEVRSRLRKLREVVFNHGAVKGKVNILNSQISLFGRWSVKEDADYCFHLTLRRA